ncbi:glycerophosphodiester phosphodiesterase [Gorillibacterium timonense]|uniref:glycerophosphodiester phosphodiesterase n=1 Tax=Gorillibacterium timonense TaxID=1689269 RepID=UPI00071D5609|nr:glycerophosphodiester phosphodiesterase [Gorillibacterium timonense]
MEQHTKIFAHRGAAGNAPENTMAAFRLAVEQGADGIELDIQMSKDGELIVIHDETLDRTTDGTGLVVARTAAELRELNAAKQMPEYPVERLPFLREVLEFLQPTALELNIELKNGIILYEGMEEKVIALVREYGMESRVIFSSFNHYSLVKLADLAPDIERGILYTAGLYEPWNYARLMGASALHPYFYSVYPEIVQGAHAAGVKVRPYTVDEEAVMKRMLACGVDGIITNYPARLKRVMEEGSR